MMRLKKTLSRFLISMGCVFSSNVLADPAPDIEKEQKAPLPEQWNTGSIYAPSPALDEQGAFAIEPYFQANIPDGQFNSHGRLKSAPSAQRQLQQSTFLKYALTERLSLYSLPAVTYAYGAHQHDSSAEFGDLPIEFEYRLTPHYTPSISVYLGFNAPTGQFSNLAHASQGVGMGAWFIRYGLQGQFARPFFHHVMRVRLWAQAREPVSSARLHNITSYGTDEGFRGRGHPGAFGDDGAALEFGLTKKFVFAIDLYHSWSASTLLKGKDASGATIHSRGGWSNSYNVGPALEYSWNSNWGVVAGVIVPVAGHNMTRVLCPTIAVSGGW